MISEITAWILALIREHFVLGLVIGVLIEGIIAPIPSPLVLMTAGFVLGEIYPAMTLGTALLKILLMITIPASIASLVGAYFVYGIAYFGGKPVLKRFGKWLGVEWEDILKLRKKLNSRQNVLIVVLRALPIMPLSPVSAAAGFLKMEWKRYGFFTLIGAIPRCFILAFFGWQFNTIYIQLAQRIEGVENLLTYLIILLVIVYILLKKFRVIDKMREKFLS